MKNKILNHKSVKWIAHRGLPSQSVENTEEGFLLASELPFYGIETDVHLTYDDIFVLHHDDNIKHLTQVDLLIEKSTYQNLLNYPLKNTQHKIPLLETYLRICKSKGKKAVIELKFPMTHQKFKKLYALIEAYDYIEHTIFISFIIDNLLHVRGINSTIEIQFLTDQFDEVILQMLKKYHMNLSIHFSKVNQEMVQIVHNHHLKIGVWTVNDIDIAEKMIELGVDYITTDGF